MKLTKEQLKQIIKEELGYLSPDELTNDQIDAKAAEIKSQGGLGLDSKEGIEAMWSEYREPTPKQIAHLSDKFPGWDKDALERLYDGITGISLRMGNEWQDEYSGIYEGKQKMKLTKEQLKRIIKEELQAVMSEEQGEIIPHAADRRDWQEKMDDAYRQANPEGPLTTWVKEPGHPSRPEQLFLNWMAKQYIADEQEIQDLYMQNRNVKEALWRIWYYTEGQGVGSDFADSNLAHARKALKGTDWDKHGSGDGSEQEGWEGIKAKADWRHGRMDET